MTGGMSPIYIDNPLFAPGIPRDPETGWIILPRDKEWRQSLFFPDAVMSHPAKMNLYMEQAMIEWVSKPGDILLDPFGGTGTLMIGALEDRTIILIELEDGYHQLQCKTRDILLQGRPDAKVILLHGDNRFLLPFPCNHIITSPPYASAMDIRRVRKGDENDNFVQADKRMMEYSKSPRNLSKLNTFTYNQAMEKVYKLCYESILSGGTLCVNIKDRIENGKRVYLSKWIEMVCTRVGFKMESWFKWLVPGNQFTNIRRSKGEITVDDEDCIIFRK